MKYILNFAHNDVTNIAIDVIRDFIEDNIIDISSLSIANFKVYSQEKDGSKFLTYFTVTMGPDTPMSRYNQILKGLELLVEQLNKILDSFSIDDVASFRHTPIHFQPMHDNPNWDPSIKSYLKTSAPSLYRPGKHVLSIKIPLNIIKEKVFNP